MPTNSSDTLPGGGNRIADITKANDYYNTTNLEGSELETAERKAVTQQEAVMAFFQKRPNGSFTPFQVWSMLRALRPDLVHPFTPVTSIRRAMSDLTNCSPAVLTKTGEKVVEKLGRPNYKWKLADPMPTTNQLKLVL